MTVQIYDVSRDEMRDATQEDVSRLMQIANCYGALRMLLRKIAETSTTDEQQKLLTKFNVALDNNLIGGKNIKKTAA